MQRREALLDAAELEFANLGFEAARLEDIAQATGVTKAVVYRHFPSKDALFLAVTARACASIERAIDETLRQPAPADELLARALRVWFEFVAERSSALAILASPTSGLGVAGELIVTTRNNIVARIARVFAGPPPPSIEMGRRQWVLVVEGCVRAIVGGAEAIAQWWSKTHPYPVEVAWLTVTNLLWLGLERLLRGELWSPPPGVGR